MELNKIDVIVSLYNKENEIKDCLLSILRQSKLPNKVIVVNNNSTDRSKIIVEEMIKESENTILELINENKQGAQYARFTGVEHSDSDFITFLDADDSILNDHLKTINDLINKYENFDVFCSSYIFRKNKKLSKSRNINSLIVTRNKKEFFLKYFFNRGMICSSNITFRKSLVSKQWIESNDRIGEDLSIWYNIISNVKFVCIDKNTVIINKTPLSANSNSIQKNESELIIKKNRNKY